MSKCPAWGLSMSAVWKKECAPDLLKFSPVCYNVCFHEGICTCSHLLLVWFLSCFKYMLSINMALPTLTNVSWPNSTLFNDNIYWVYFRLLFLNDFTIIVPHFPDMMSPSTLRAVRQETCAAQRGNAVHCPGFGFGGSSARALPGFERTRSGFVFSCAGGWVCRN
jgi:hypothetical protein